MSHVLSVRREGKYLHITVTGDNTVQDVQRYLTEVREACAEHKCPSVLIEENLRGKSIGTLDIFNVISKLAQPSAVVRCIAYVDVNPEHDAKRMDFAETVAINRGIGIRIFPDIPAARMWIAQYSSGG